MIHILQPQLERLLKNALEKFVKPGVLIGVITGCLKNAGLLFVDFKDATNHITNNNLMTGFLTKQTVAKLLEERNIFLTFYNILQAFFSGRILGEVMSSKG